MGYPDYPNNRLIVNGVDLSEKFKMVLVDGYTLAPPEPKTYLVDIPGGNGKLDLTESLLGDTAYNNRKQEFIFYVLNISDVEQVKTDISNFLHGKEYDYEMTMDPGYIYHGRFTVSSYSHEVYGTTIATKLGVNIEAKPFKMRKTQVYQIDGIGGTTVYLESGRMRVNPVIETGSITRIIKDKNLLNLPQGTWKVNDIAFKQGSNELYVNTCDIRNLTWGDLKTNSVTWGNFKKKRIYEWYKSNGDGTYVVKKWSDLRSSTWEDLEDSQWSDLMYESEVTKNVSKVYVKYEWGDL